MPDLDQLRQIYAGLSDTELERIAIHEAADLLPEAISILHEELRKRNLAESLGLAVNAQARKWTPQELEELVQRVREFPCPVCRATKQPLNVFKIVSLHGFLFFAQKTTTLLLGCPDCIERAARNAERSWLLAWLHSPIAAYSASVANLKAQNAHEVTEPTADFTDYVLQNLGPITLALKERHRERG
jgi:hypothetical protein